MSTTFTLHVFALQFWWLLDLCGSEGRIGDGSDNRICGCSLPLSAFFLSYFSIPLVPALRLAP